MRIHATDVGVSTTLCGREDVAVNNADPTCKACLRVIKSRCYSHNVKQCQICVK